VVPQPAQPAHDARAPAQRVRAAALRGGAADRGRARAHQGGLRPMKDPRTVVRKALITEKGTVLREVRNQYLFEVARDANKIDIKRAIEAIFHVQVASVRTQQMLGKVRRQGRFVGKRSDWKKAIVTLKPDQ